MKTYETKNIRNVVLLGSPKSGKTTFVESMMFEGKVIDRRGSVEGKNTMSDNTEIEQIYQRSIYSTLLYTEFMDTKFNIIDTPGSDDFVGGVYSAFSVCDSGIVLVNATQGVEVGTEIFIRQAQKHNKPLVIAVNQLDSEKADWHQAIDSLKNVYGGKIVLVQFPVSVGTEFNAFVDVLKMKMYRFKDDNGTREELEIPADLMDEAQTLQQELIEKAAENDEQLMEIFFDKGSLTEDEVRSGLKAGMLKDEIFPVFCLSAKKDIGVKRVMEFVINTLPDPGQHESELKEGGSVKVDANGPTSLFFYKTALEQHLGDVAYFKVMTGTLKEGMDLYNPARTRIRTVRRRRSRNGAKSIRSRRCGGTWRPPGLFPLRCLRKWTQLSSNTSPGSRGWRRTRTSRRGPIPCGNPMRSANTISRTDEARLPRRSPDGTSRSRSKRTRGGKSSRAKQDIIRTPRALRSQS